jgi:hypothetical protein
VATKGSYDPTGGLRGEVEDKKFSGSADEASDSCGMWERGNHILLRVMSRQGEHGVPYNLQGYSRAKTGVTFRMAGSLELDGQPEREGMWKVIVAGDGLDDIIRQICKGSRTILKPGSSPDGKTRITSIDIEAWDYEP